MKPNQFPPEIRQLPTLCQYNRLHYSKFTFEEFQKIIDYLKAHLDDPRPNFNTVSAWTGVSVRLLSKWRTEVKSNPSYNPKVHYNKLHHAMSERLEEQIVNEIETQFLQPGYFFNNSILKVIAKAAFDNAPPEDKFRQNFYASDKWCKAFRLRHGYVWRKAHLKKRPALSEKTRQLISNFQQEMRGLHEDLKRSNLLFTMANMDETSWKLAYPGQLTWAKRGAKEVKVLTSFNPKDDFTSIATVTATSEKLPLFLIAKGKTEKSHKQFGECQEMPDKCYITHSQSGWAKGEVILDYLHFLREAYNKKFSQNPHYTPQTTIHLILDCYSSHLKEEVRQKASNLKIQLHFIPAGTTDFMQPLDIKVFGCLKAAARHEWHVISTQDPKFKPNRCNAAKVLIKCYENLSDSVLEGAWELYKKIKKEADEEDLPLFEGMSEETEEEVHKTIYQTINSSLHERNSSETEESSPSEDIDDEYSETEDMTSDDDK